MGFGEKKKYLLVFFGVDKKKIFYPLLDINVSFTSNPFHFRALEPWVQPCFKMAHSSQINFEFKMLICCSKNITYKIGSVL